MKNIKRKRVTMPAGIELTLEAEKNVQILPNSRILSMGSGTGELEAYLTEKYRCRLTGIDIDAELVKSASRMAREKGLDSRLVFEVKDAGHTGYPDETFDIIYSCGSLSEFFDDGVKEIRRLLKPNGNAIIIDTAFTGDLIPKDLVKNWLGREISIFNGEGMRNEFQKLGFTTVFSRVYRDPVWWDVYYSDRGDDPKWTAEKERFLKYQDFLGTGLFIFAKEENLYQI